MHFIEQLHAHLEAPAADTALDLIPHDCVSLGRYFKRVQRVLQSEGVRLEKIIFVREYTSRDEVVSFGDFGSWSNLRLLELLGFMRISDEDEGILESKSFLEKGNFFF